MNLAGFMVVPWAGGDVRPLDGSGVYQYSGVDVGQGGSSLFYSKRPSFTGKPQYMSCSFGFARFKRRE